MDGFRQLAAVAGVLSLLAAALVCLRRRGIAGILPARSTYTRRLECLEHLSLGPQHALHLVRLGRTELLVASSPNGCSLVRSIPGGAVPKGSEVAR